MKGMLMGLGIVASAFCAFMAFMHGDYVGQFISSIATMGCIIIAMFWWDTRNTMAELTLQIENLTQEHEENIRQIGFMIDED